MKRYNRGITLIELMVVTVIIAILAAIAYPSYRQYVMRSNRTEAKVALLQTAQGLEKCFTRYHAYDDARCAISTTFSTPEGNYAVASTTLTDDAFTLVATAQAGQATDVRCATLSIDEAGRQQATGGGTDCW